MMMPCTTYQTEPAVRKERKSYIIELAGSLALSKCGKKYCKLYSSNLIHNTEQRLVFHLLHNKHDDDDDDPYMATLDVGSVFGNKCHGSLCVPTYDS